MQKIDNCKDIRLALALLKDTCPGLQSSVQTSQAMPSFLSQRHGASLVLSEPPHGDPESFVASRVVHSREIRRARRSVKPRSCGLDCELSLS
jgi:hypothetical protein